MTDPRLPKLPEVQMLMRICQSIATLDALLSPDWQYRYYSFNSKWGDGEQMASMRDGCGDSYFILFNRHGAILKGYAHESAAAHFVVEHDKPLPGMFDGVPEEFAGFLREPAFSISETTFCFWRRYADPRWFSGLGRYPQNPDPGGAVELLSILEGDPDFYVRWAEGYYEVPVNASAVRQIYRQEPLSEELVHTLNPQVTLDAIKDDINEIGYPA